MLREQYWDLIYLFFPASIVFTLVSFTEHQDNPQWIENKQTKKNLKNFQSLALKFWFLFISTLTHPLSDEISLRKREWPFSDVLLHIQFAPIKNKQKIARIQNGITCAKTHDIKSRFITWPNCSSDLHQISNLFSLGFSDFGKVIHHKDSLHFPKR